MIFNLFNFAVRQSKRKGKNKVLTRIIKVTGPMKLQIK